MRKIFITGTDTAIGKTTVTTLLLEKLNEAGYQTFGLKPLSSGLNLDAKDRWVNEDVIELQKAASLKRSYDIINPIALKDPIAPHLAAKFVGKTLSVSEVVKASYQSLEVVKEADITLIEGVGGWHVPLNETELFSDVVLALKVPVILVVGIRLGCLNHTILTHQAIQASQIPFLGWVANCLDSNAFLCEENIETLKHWLSAPCLGVVPFGLEKIRENTIDVSYLATIAEQFLTEPRPSGSGGSE